MSKYDGIYYGLDWQQRLWLQIWSELDHYEIISFMSVDNKVEISVPTTAKFVYNKVEISVPTTAKFVPNDKHAVVHLTDILCMYVSSCHCGRMC